MSFLTDLVHGNTGNLGNDISHDPWGTAGVVAGTAGLGLLAAPAIGGLLGLGGAEAAGAGAVGAEALGAGAGATEAALGFAGDVGATGGAAAGAATDATSTALGLAPTAAAPTTATTAVANAAGSGFDPSAGLDPLKFLYDSPSTVPGGTPSGLPTSGGVGNIASSYNGADALTAGGGGSSGPGGSAPEGAPAGAGKSFLENLGTGISNIPNQLAGDPLKLAAPLVGAAGLGYSLYNQKNNPAGGAAQNQLNAIAPGQISQGEGLQQYLTNGTLPPGAQAQVDQQIKAAKAQAVSAAAKSGLPTDPSQNSALAAQFAQIESSAVQQQQQLASNLFNQGSAEVGVGTGVLNNIMQVNQQQTAQTGQAISSFASSLAGLSGVKPKTQPTYATG